MNEIAQKRNAFRARSFLSWAFLISIAVHFTFGGLVHFKPYYEPEPKTPKLSITQVAVPTPKPTVPPPSPPPKATPLPHVEPHRPSHALSVHTPRTHSHGSVPTEPQYSPSPGGDQNGLPQPGDSTAAPLAAETATPAIHPLPVPTPTRPSCAAPHVDARTTQKADADYPALAQAQGATGTVTVKVALSASGAVESATVYKGSGNSALDQAALKAARNSRYAPEIEDCQKVPGQYLFVVEFASQ